MLVSAVIDSIIRRESDQYTNDPLDRGGPTKYGITLKTLQQLRPGATVRDVQNLTEAEARSIYAMVYGAPFARFDSASDLFALAVDSAVQHGVERVQGWLKAIPSNDPNVNYVGLFSRRMQFYGEIVKSDPSQLKYINGWLNRLAEFVR